MKNAKSPLLALALMVAAAPLALASSEERPDAGRAQSAAPETVIYDAASAYEFLKTLAGDWKGSKGSNDHSHIPGSVNFRVTAAGSSVIETSSPGEAMEMVTLFHMNGGDLLFTHYCALQNQPQLKFVKSDKPGEIKFAFHGGTNFDPAIDAHVHEGAIRIKDKNTIESDFEVFAAGKPSRTNSAVLKRAGN